MIRYALLTLTLLLSTAAYSQSYTYTYVDPCTKLVKSVTIPDGQANIQVTYYGTVGNFSQSDFQSGVFNAWMNGVSQINSNKPCDQLATATTTQTNMIVTQNIISTLTNITSVSMMAADLANNIANVSSSSVSNALGNATNNSSSSSGGNEEGNSESSGSGGSGGESGGSGSSSSGESNGTSSPGSGGSGGSGSSSGEGQGGGQGGSGTEGPGQSGEESSNRSGGNSGTANSVNNAAEGNSNSGSSGGGKNSSKTTAKTGSVIGTGDLVVIRNAEDKGDRDQFKFTLSATHSNTKNTFAKGFLGNFTTQINNSNITFYGAWTKKTSTLIVANSSMLNFQKDFFNTTTALGSYRYKKFSGMLGLNATVGNLGKTTFMNVSAVGGSFFMFKPTKKITGTILVLGVYSPFTQFYEGKWWDSGLLLVPFSSWDYSITKKFKFNISMSGVYQSSGSVLNYQVLTGGKVLF